MSSEKRGESKSEAIEHLEQFGLSAYAARTFVALTSLGKGTAKDVSRVSDVPRTRVYDAVEELQDRDLVDVQEASPQEFWVVSPDTAGRRFEREIHRRTDALRTVLDDLEPVESNGSQQDVWTVGGRVAVTDLVLELCEAATETVTYVTDESLLDDDVLGGLREAAERGVEVHVAGVSPEALEVVSNQVRGVEAFETSWFGPETPAGRLLMVDDERTLVSALVDDHEAAEEGDSVEIAIWGAGERNSLVVVLRAVFSLDRVRP